MRIIPRQSKKGRFSAARRAGGFGLVLYAAANIGSGYSGPACAAAAPARADLITLSDNNIADYLQPKEGINWLAAADPDRRQNYQLADFIWLETLGLKAANTDLTIDTRQNSFPFMPSLIVEDSLHIGAGRLNIIAARTAAKSLDSADPPFPDFPSLAVNFVAKPGERNDFIQTGGLVAIQAQDNATAISGGNFYAMQGGSLMVRAEQEATALNLAYSDLETGSHNGADILFRQSGGAIAFDAKDNSIGLKSNQSVAISGGSWHMHTAGQAQAVLLNDAEAEFRQQSGLVTIIAAENSAGLTAARLRMTGGRLFLLGRDSAKAIHLTSGRREDGSLTAGAFLFEGGVMEFAGTSGLARPNDRAYAVYGDDNSRAIFGKDSVLRPIITVDPVGPQTSGLLSFARVRIMPQARLDIADIIVRNSYRLTANSALSLNFLESREALIDGRFTISRGAPQQKLFYTYAVDLSPDGQHYQLRLEPKSRNSGNHTGSNALRVSDIVGGNNRRAAAAMEKFLLSPAAGSQTAPYPRLEILYNALYNSNSGEEKQLDRNLRRFSPSQATRLPAISRTIQEEFTDTVRRAVLPLLAPGAAGNSATAGQTAPAIAGKGGDSATIWLKPTGGHGQYRGQNRSFSHLSADYGGFNFGAAASCGAFAYSAAGGFMTGRLQGGAADHIIMRHGLVGASLAYAPPGHSRARPVADMHFSYAYGRFKQSRHDNFAAINRAYINQHSFMTGAALSRYYRLTRHRLQWAPQFGLDYAYINQNGFQEKGGILPLRVKSAVLNALRPKIGAAILWNGGGRQAFSAYAHYHYDLLDTNINLDTQLRAAHAVAWRSKGENSNPSSITGGMEFSYYWRSSVGFSGAYNVTARPNRTAQQFSARIKISF